MRKDLADYVGLEGVVMDHVNEIHKPPFVMLRRRQQQKQAVVLFINRGLISIVDSVKNIVIIFWG